MADAPPILHLISPLRHVSPFDVNMAVDAGFPTVVPYAGVALEDVAALTQDMMFSRAPHHAVRTGLFIGGKDAGLALDMLHAARGALFPPFQISVFADPGGSFTTAAAMIALVERHLRAAGHDGLKVASVLVFGATGVVGGIAAVIAAQASAKVTLVGHRGLEPVAEKAAEFKRRFGVDLAAVDAPDDAGKRAILPQAEVVLAAGRAGVQVLTAAQLAAAARLLVAADVNAVPPTGVEGVAADDDGKPLAHGVGIGALAIGRIKFQVQHDLLNRMRTSDTALAIGIEEAVALARKIVG